MAGDAHLAVLVQVAHGEVLAAVRALGLFAKVHRLDVALERVAGHHAFVALIARKVALLPVDVEVVGVEVLHLFAALEALFAHLQVHSGYVQPVKNSCL